MCVNSFGMRFYREFGMTDGMKKSLIVFTVVDTCSFLSCGGEAEIIYIHILEVCILSFPFLVIYI